MKRSTTPDEIEKEILKELRKEHAILPPDEDLLFGQSIGASLQTLLPQQKALAKMRIQQVLYDVQYCNVQASPYYPQSENSSTC